MASDAAPVAVRPLRESGRPCDCCSLNSTPPDSPRMNGRHGSAASHGQELIQTRAALGRRTGKCSGHAEEYFCAKARGSVVECAGTTKGESRTVPQRRENWNELQK